jgi:hypothetical protein
VEQAKAKPQQIFSRNDNHNGNGKGSLAGGRFYIPPIAKVRDGWGTRFVLAGEREQGQQQRQRQQHAQQQ